MFFAKVFPQTGHRLPLLLATSALALVAGSNLDWGRWEMDEAPLWQAMTAEQGGAEASDDRSVVFTSQLELDELAELTHFCVVPDPQIPSSAFLIHQGPNLGAAGQVVRYECAEPCGDWRECQVPAYEEDSGPPLMHVRSPVRQKQALAFVIDGMGGHIAYSTDTADAEKALFVHQGGGGVTYHHEHTEQLEDRSAYKTFMMRWEKGYQSVEIDAVNWGWFTRSIEGPSLIPVLNRRVAAVLAWIHENMTFGAPFGTVGCSMGATATLGPVLWHGLDPVIDYQFLAGGPPIGDLNAICRRRTYETGFCDFDGVTPCAADADCAGRGLCRKPVHISQTHMIEGMINHVHAAVRPLCRALLATPDQAPSLLLDASSMLHSGWNWTLTHPMDMLADIGGVPNLQFPLPEDWNSDVSIRFGGDEHWGLGHFLQIYNRLDATGGKTWVAAPGSHHCASMQNGRAADMVIAAMRRL